MSDPLKDLKKAMDKTVFLDLKFSKKQREIILKSADDDVEKSIEIVLLKSLEEGSKPGFEIYSYIQNDIAREGLKEREGRLYVILHRLAQKRFISSTWIEEEKIYHLEKKGRRLLAEWSKAKSKAERRSLILEVGGGWA